MRTIEQAKNINKNLDLVAALDRQDLASEYQTAKVPRKQQEVSDKARSTARSKDKRDLFRQILTPATRIDEEVDYKKNLAQSRNQIKNASTQLSQDTTSGKCYLIRSSGVPAKKLGEKFMSQEVIGLERKMLKNQSDQNLLLQAGDQYLLPQKHLRVPLRNSLEVPSSTHRDTRTARIPQAFQIETRSSGESLPKVHDAVGHCGLRSEQKGTALIPNAKREK